MDHLSQRLLAASACAALLASPGTALAQPDTFAAGLSAFSDAVAGTYGDEGAHIAPALEKMAAALAQWDREIQELEARLASDRRDAAPTLAARLRTQLARTFAQRGRFRDALREIDAAARLDPSAFPAHLLRAQVLEASSSTLAASEAFRIAWTRSQRDPVAAYHVLRHAARINPQVVQAALDTLIAASRRLSEEDAGSASAPFEGVGLLHQPQGEALGVTPVIYRHGYALIARGQYDDAIAEFRRAAAGDPLMVDALSGSSAAAPAVAALREGRTAEARSLLDGAAVGESSEAHRVLGLISWADSQFDRSVQELAIAIQLNPRNERARLALARVLSSAGRESEAERTLLEMLQVLPDSALARVWLGQGYEAANRFAEARQQFEIAAPGVITGRGAYFAAIGRLAAAAGDFPGAIDAFTLSIAARPNDPDAHKRLAHALLQEERVPEAFGELVAALLVDPGDAGAHVGVGRLHLNAGRHQDAAAALRRAVELSPDYTEARYALATALARLGRATEAAQEFERVEQAQRREIDDRRRALMLATLKEEAALRTAEGNHDHAATLWRQAIERDPGRPSNHLSLAAALVSDGQFHHAIEQYEIAIRLGADPLVYGDLADVYARVGRTAEASHARAEYARALQRNATRASGAP